MANTAQQDTTDWSPTGLRRFIFGSIRNKIVLPFLIVTALVASGGTFIVTRLVASSAQDRLTNQLIETSRSASDSIVNWEQTHLEMLRLVVFTLGVPEAFRDGDSAFLTDTLLGLAANQDAYMLLALDKHGTALADVRQTATDYVVGSFVDQDLSVLPMIAPVLEGRTDEFGDKYAGIITVDGDIIMMTAAPVRDSGGELVGVVAIGSPMKQVLLQTKSNVLADLTLYQVDGQVLETTFVLVGEASLESLKIQPETYNEALASAETSTVLREITVNERQFQVAYIPLKIRRDTLGILGIAYPTTIISTLITTNRNTLGVIFALVAAMVVVIGYVVARNLSAPIQKLAEVAEAVRAGDLSQRSGVRTSDEIGVLGLTFDAMTHKLDAQTQALRQAYEEQEKETAFLSAVLMSTGDGVVVILPDGTIARSNPVAHEIIMSDQNLWLTELSRLVTRFLRGDQARQRVEMDNRWIEALAAPVHTVTGEEIGVVVTLRDVTDQVLNERMRTAFIMQMSHELYTPLTAIKGYVDLAKATMSEESARPRHFIDLAASQTGVLNRLITQMLDVAQMIRGGLEITPGPVDIREMIQAVVDEHQDMIRSKNLDVQVSFGQLNPYEGDRDRLQWAFKHLVNNACTYTLPGGKVTISVDSENTTWVVRVRDSGVGISPRDLPRVFEQFYRGYPVTPDGALIDVRGAGLGLFVVAKVIQAHGGQVDIWSKQGEGTELTVTLPYDANLG